MARMKVHYCPRCGYFYVLMTGQRQHECGSSTFKPLVGKPSERGMGKQARKQGRQQK